MQLKNNKIALCCLFENNVVWVAMSTSFARLLEIQCVVQGNFIDNAQSTIMGPSGTFNFHQLERGCPVSPRIAHCLINFFVLQCIRCQSSICIVDMIGQNLVFVFLPNCVLFIHK